MSERCNTYRNFWKLYRWGIVQLVLLDFIFNLYLWKENEFAEIHQIYRDIRSWISFYPERRKVVLYIMKYKLILWISVDEVGNHAV